MSALALWNLLPRWAKEVLVLLVAVAAIYAFGDCHGRSVQRQQDTTAEQARLTARLARQRDSLTKHAYTQGQTAQSTRDTLTRTVTRYVTLRAALPSVLPSTGDTLHVRYSDGHVARLPVSPAVDSLVTSYAEQIAVADTLVQNAQAAARADSAALATLWSAGKVTGSLVTVQAQQIDGLNRALAHCRPSPVGRVVKVAEWAALAYAGAKVYQTLRH